VGGLVKVVLLGMNSPTSEVLGFVNKGGAGARLLELTGLDEEEYIRKYQRINLLSSKSWSASLAKKKAFRMKRLLRGRTVVVLGKGVWSALGLPEIEWLGVHCEGKTTWALIPHPSGKNHFYNSGENKKLVRRFLKDVSDEDNIGRHRSHSL
jgi:hypothetical protein